MSDYNERMSKMNATEKADYDEKKKVAAEAYKARKDAAKKIINTFLESTESKKLTPEVREAIEYIAGSGQRSARTGVTSALKELLEQGPVSTIDIFTKFEYGKPTMDIKIREFIKNPKDVNDRIWVALQNGNYEIVGRGEFAPEGWTGYQIPVKVEAEEL